MAHYNFLTVQMCDECHAFTPQVGIKDDGQYTGGVPTGAAIGDYIIWDSTPGQGGQSAMCGEVIAVCAEGMGCDLFFAYVIAGPYSNCTACKTACLLPPIDVDCITCGGTTTTPEPDPTTTTTTTTTAAPCNCYLNNSGYNGTGLWGCRKDWWFLWPPYTTGPEYGVPGYPGYVSQLGLADCLANCCPTTTTTPEPPADPTTTTTAAPQGTTTTCPHEHRIVDWVGGQTSYRGDDINGPGQGNKACADCDNDGTKEAYRCLISVEQKCPPDCPIIPNESPCTLNSTIWVHDPPYDPCCGFEPTTTTTTTTSGPTTTTTTCDCIFHPGSGPTGTTSGPTTTTTCGPPTSKATFKFDIGTACCPCEKIGTYNDNVCDPCCTTTTSSGETPCPTVPNLGIEIHRCANGVVAGYGISTLNGCPNPYDYVVKDGPAPSEVIGKILKLNLGPGQPVACFWVRSAIEVTDAMFEMGPWWNICAKVTVDRSANGTGIYEPNILPGPGSNCMPCIDGIGELTCTTTTASPPFWSCPTLPANTYVDYQTCLDECCDATTTTTSEPCLGCHGVGDSTGVNPWQGNTGTENYQCGTCGDFTTSVVTFDCGQGTQCFYCSDDVDANDGTGNTQTGTGGPCDGHGWTVCVCCDETTTTAAPTTTTSPPPECDLTEIFNHVKGNITANGGVFLGDNHGAASITGWISDHVATLGINVFFIEMIASADQATLDAYVNGGGAHGSTEHCNLIEAMTGWDTKEAVCCSAAWDPDNFVDEYIRIIDACISASIAVKTLDTTGTLDQRNAHWASIVNTYLTANSSHKFVIYGGAGHSANYPANQGVDMRITGKTVISYDFNSPSLEGDCDGVTIDGVTTGLGAWENQKCMCMLSCVDPLNCDYQIYVNDCNQAGDGYVDYDCTIVTQLVRPACPTTTTTTGAATTTTPCPCPSNCWMNRYYPPGTSGAPPAWQVGDTVKCCAYTNGCKTSRLNYNGVDYGLGPTDHSCTSPCEGCWRVVNATLANQVGGNCDPSIPQSGCQVNGPDGYPGGPTDWWYVSPNLCPSTVWEWLPNCNGCPCTTTTAAPTTTTTTGDPSGCCDGGTQIYRAKICGVCSEGTAENCTESACTAAGGTWQSVGSNTPMNTIIYVCMSSSPQGQNPQIGNFHVALRCSSEPLYACVELLPPVGFPNQGGDAEDVSGPGVTATREFDPNTFSANCCCSSGSGGGGP